ncbi:MAG: nitronate monooxygenase [Pseudomonadota bacterium]
MTTQRLRTRLTDRFGIKHPIIAAPMALISGGALAGAVSRAGGLGLLGGGYAGTLGREPDLQAEYQKAGNTRIGVGFITWALDEALKTTPALLDDILARDPACLFLSFGDPTPHANAAADRGVPVICQCQTIEDARKALDAGATAIVAQGTEAGGHGGARATLPFVPEAVDLVTQQAPDTLVLAAGGIADGRGLAAALMLGADGAVVGSRFWAAEEALTHPEATRRAAAATGDVTIRSGLLDTLRGTPWPAPYTFRTLKNRLTEDWAGRETEAEFGQLADAYNAARADGDHDVVASVVGEATGLIHDRPPAADIIESMISRAIEQISKASGLIDTMA